MSYHKNNSSVDRTNLEAFLEQLNAKLQAAIKDRMTIRVNVNNVWDASKSEGFFQDAPRLAGYTLTITVGETSAVRGIDVRGEDE